MFIAFSENFAAKNLNAVIPAESSKRLLLPFAISRGQMLRCDWFVQRLAGNLTNPTVVDPYTQST